MGAGTVEYALNALNAVSGLAAAVAHGLQHVPSRAAEVITAPLQAFPAEHGRLATPTPEIPTALFIGAGLLILFAYLVLRRV